MTGIKKKKGLSNIRKHTNVITKTGVDFAMLFCESATKLLGDAPFETGEDCAEISGLHFLYYVSLPGFAYEGYFYLPVEN